MKKSQFLSERILRNYVRSVLLEYPENKCPKCGVDGPSGKKFCAKCGTKMGVCPKCENPLGTESNQKFCKKCGEKLPPPGEENANPNLAQKLQSMIDSSKKSYEIANKSSAARSALSDAIQKRIKILVGLMDAIQKNDQEAVKKGKEALKDANEELTAAGRENMDAFMKWSADMEARGVKIPADMKKGLEDEIKEHQKSIVDDYKSLQDLASAVAEKYDDSPESFKKWAIKKSDNKKGDYGAMISFAAMYCHMKGENDKSKSLTSALDKMKEEFVSKKKAVIVSKDEAEKILSNVGLEDWF